ncbi:hypothetical protein [Cryptosporangium aurantiacum]|uniref:Uncharacterized protein n=1 Tax=Cryptosporangium aurantiacum TaxID=134849 RepID=A0A1M7RLW5_9ACTN|nr:hypothetical protein [Cryptosporangium aurantiacum]SHN47092.1 hypothetical protein SAMN05443668_12048 [Cryptosporangium aurantiacum]
MSRTRLGWLLLTPALLALLWSYVIPTAMTFDIDGSTRDSSYPEYLGRAALLAVVPLVLTLLAAPALAWAAQRAGRRGRLVTRIVLCVPLAGFAPAAYLLGWTFLSRDEGRPDSVFLALAVASAGAVIAAATTVYLAAFRDADRPKGSLYVVGAVLAAASLAGALQVFTAPYVVVVADPFHRPMTTPLGAALYGAEPGEQSVVSLLLLVPLAVLGLLATWLLLRSRARIEFAPVVGTEPPRRGAWLLLAPLLVLLLAIVALTAGPWWQSLPDANGSGDFSAAEIYRDTWLPPLISAVVSVLVAALGGYALGVLRPLGERSEQALLLFAPWLFVGIGPLVFAYENRITGGDPRWFDLVPPVWVSIPALVVFTLFFRGRLAQGATAKAAVRSAIPLAGIAVVVHWMLGAQDLLWPAMAGNDGYTHITTTPLATMTAGLGESLTRALAVDMILPLPVFMALLGLAILAQVGYLDRLAIRTEARRAPAAQEPDGDDADD